MCTNERTVDEKRSPRRGKLTHELERRRSGLGGLGRARSGLGWSDLAWLGHAWGHTRAWVHCSSEVARPRLAGGGGERKRKRERERKKKKGRKEREEREEGGGGKWFFFGFIGVVRVLNPEYIAFSVFHKKIYFRSF